MSTAPDTPPQYECTRCGNCCRWEGYVLLTPAEVDAIAAHLGLSVAAFTTDHTRLTRRRAELSLTEKNDGSCVFLAEPNVCRIYPVRPSQCRDFPNRWRFPAFERVCDARRLAPPDNEQARGSDPRA